MDVVTSDSRKIRAHAEEEGLEPVDRLLLIGIYL
jgi:hypothetical protein